MRSSSQSAQNGLTHSSIAAASHHSAQSYMTAHKARVATGNDAMPSYLDAQVTASNYLSRKPVRAQSTIRHVSPPIDIPSSPPLCAMDVQAMRTTPRAEHMDYEYQNTRNPQLFQSNYRFARHSLNQSHPFQLLPIPVNPVKSFAFSIESLVEEVPGVLYRAFGDFTAGDTIVHRARPHSCREISAAELGTAYAAAAIIAEPLAARSVPQKISQDWRDTERHSQAFNYDTSEVYEEVERFDDAHEILVDIVGDRDVSYASYYLDALEEQTEEDVMGWEGEHKQVVSDVVMSDDMPQSSLAGPHDDPVLAEHADDHHLASHYGAHVSGPGPGETRDKNMIEVRSPGRAGKMIEAARLNDYRG